MSEFGIEPLNFSDFVYLYAWKVPQIDNIPDELKKLADFHRIHQAYIWRRIHYAITCVKANVEYGGIDPNEFINIHPIETYYDISELPD